MTTRGIIIAERFIRPRRVAKFVIKFADDGAGGVNWSTAGVGAGTLVSGWNYLKNMEVFQIRSFVSFVDLEVRIDARSAFSGLFEDLPQDFFTSITIDNANGTPLTYLTSNVESFTPGSGVGTWSWGTGSSLPNTDADAGEDKDVLITI